MHSTATTWVKGRQKQTNTTWCLLFLIDFQIHRWVKQWLLSCSAFLALENVWLGDCCYIMLNNRKKEASSVILVIISSLLSLRCRKCYKPHFKGEIIFMLEVENYFFKVDNSVCIKVTAPNWLLHTLATCSWGKRGTFRLLTSATHCLKKYIF